MVKDVNGRFDDYSVVPTNFITQGYELVKKEFVMIYFFVYIKMSYYWFNRKEVLQKAKDI